MNDFFSSFYPLEKLQFGSDDTVYTLNVAKASEAMSNVETSTYLKKS